MAIGSEAQALRQRRVEAAFDDAEDRAQRTAARVVLVAIAVIGVWITQENGFPAVLFYYPFLLIFAVVMAAPIVFWRRSRPPAWLRYVRFPLSVVLYTAMALTQNPFIDDLRTGPMLLRWQNEIYLFVFIAGSAFSYSPRVVMLTGASAALSWTAAAIWISRQPGVYTTVPEEFWTSIATVAERRAVMMDPNRIFLNGVIRVDLVLVVTASLLAAFVQRSRRIVVRQAEAERERANLSRYFSPNMVEELAQSDLPLSTTRRQDAAVLFIDLVGFTALSSRQDPEAVIETLRQFHHRVERAVFAHQGTLEKYIGDGAMATFGTPRPGPADATNAVRCVGTLLDSLAGWNDERARRGLGSMRAGIGVHYGAIVLGDIGGEQRLEFAVVGDTVNVASRLEHLTREISADAVLSGDLLDAVSREGGDAAALLPRLQQVATRPVRGRDEPLRLWVIPTSAASPMP